MGKLAAEGKVEYKLRRDADKKEITASDAVSRAIEIVNKERRG